MSKSLVPGSLGAVAQRNGASIAESFLSADVLILIDVSGSMAQADARGGRERYTVACEELAHLQASMPGKIGVVAFSSSVQFVPGGVPLFEGGTTDLAKALRFVQVADGCVKFVVVTDGQPDSESDAMDIARTFKSPISVVYVGPEDERSGAEFLQRLAKASGGRYVVAEHADELAERVERLLLTSA